MANLSNNNAPASLPYSSLRGAGTTTKQSNNSNSQWLLLLFISFFIFHISYAQQGYKKLFTNSATASIFQSVVPQGFNNCMIMAIVNDSLDKKQGIRISRISADGSVLASSYYNTPEYPKTFIYPSWHNACRINDNLFVFSGTGGDSTCGQPGFILTADSNGVVQKFQSIKPAACGSSDCFMWSAQVRYDSVRQQIIFGGHSKCSTGMKPYLIKYDTSLHLIWSKTYPSFVYPTNGMHCLIIDKDQYILGGLADNGYDSHNKLWDTKSVMLAVDTGGTMRWVYTSPASEMRGAVVSAIATPDGGYVYSTMGLGYNRRPAASPTADFYGKLMLVKLDALRNEEWVKVIDSTYSPFSGLAGGLLLPCDDSTFYSMYLNLDSIASNDYDGQRFLVKYTFAGTEKWRRQITTSNPADTLVGGFVDMQQMRDKSIVLVGMTDNSILSSPTQRGFAMRVDSNGCLGPSDPQCDPLSIPKLPQIAKVGFSVYPNPASNSINLSISANELKVYNTLGQIVLQASNIEAHQPISVSLLSSGLYYLEVYDREKNKVGVGKFYKE